MAYDSYIERIH